MTMMNSQDAISGKEGMIFMTVGDVTMEWAELIKFDAKIEYTKAEVKGVGRRMKGYKIVGAEGNGDMEFYYHRPEMRKMANDYVKKGIAPVFSAQVVNADVTSKAGKQDVKIYNIVPDSTRIAALDGDSDELLRDDMSFTFDDFDMLESFEVVEY